MKGFYITVKNGLLDSKHFKAMHGDRDSGTIWLFLWLLDKMTIVDHEKGEGKVLGGRPIKYEAIERDLGISRRTYAYYIKILREGGYVATTRTPYGLTIIVYKAFKVFGQKTNSDAALLAHHSTPIPSHITPPLSPRTSNKDNTVDNTIQDSTFKTNFKKPKANKNTMPAAKRLCKLFEEYKGGVFGGMHLTNATKIIARHGEVAVIDLARWCLDEYKSRQFEPVVKGPIDLGDHWDDLIDIRSGNRRGQPERKSRYGIKY